MIRQLLLSFMFLFVMSSSISAQCPDESQIIKLSNQQEVEDFLISYPNCDRLGELEISGTVSDLSGLYNLTQLEYLYFDDCTVLPHLDGLHNIDSINGNLGFYDDLGFADLCGLSSLVYIGNDLRFEGTSKLSTLMGMESLLYIKDDLTIDDNLDLDNLNGIQNLIQIGDVTTGGGRIEITDNSVLNDCCGIAHLIGLNTGVNAELSGNGVNCNTEMSITNSDCNFDYTPCVTSSILNKLDRSINIFPNPSDSYFIIDGLGEVQIIKHELVGVDGTVFKIQREFNLFTDLDNLSSGVYLLNLQTSNGNITKKVIITH